MTYSFSFRSYVQFFTESRNASTDIHACAARVAFHRTAGNSEAAACRGGSGLVTIACPLQPAEVSSMSTIRRWMFPAYTATLVLSIALHAGVPVGRAQTPDAAQSAVDSAVRKAFQWRSIGPWRGGRSI